MVLKYRIPSFVTQGEWEVVTQQVPIEWTPCRYGGRRPWFLCPAPGCGRRVATLYGRRDFRCRHCCNLAYRSQLENAGNRAIRRAQKIRMRLGGSPNLLDPFPQKPARMHWVTYWQLRESAEHAEIQAFQASGAWMGRLESVLAKESAAKRK